MFVTDFYLGSKFTFLTFVHLFLDTMEPSVFTEYILYFLFLVFYFSYSP